MKRKPNDEVRRLQKEISNWQVDLTKPTILKKAGGIISKPVNWVFDKLPNGITQVIGKSIEGLFDLLILGANYTFSNKSVFDSINKNGGSSITKREDLLNQSITTLNKTALSHLTENKIIAILEGTSLGFGGFVLIAADIPLLFGICFRVIQQIGTTFGFDLESPQEKQLMMRLIDFSSSAPTVAKLKTMFNKEALLQFIKSTTLKEMEAIAAIKAGQIALEDAARQMLKQQGKRATQKAISDVAAKLAAEAAKNGAKASAIIAARQSAKDIGQNLTKKKITQWIPILGAIVGGAFNFWFVKKVAESAYYFYLNRHINDNYDLQY